MSNPLKGWSKELRISLNLLETFLNRFKWFTRIIYKNYKNLFPKIHPNLRLPSKASIEKPVEQLQSTQKAVHTMRSMLWRFTRWSPQYEVHSVQSFENWEFSQTYKRVWLRLWELNLKPSLTRFKRSTATVDRLLTQPFGQRFKGRTHLMFVVFESEECARWHWDLEVSSFDQIIVIHFLEVRWFSAPFNVGRFRTNSHYLQFWIPWCWSFDLNPVYADSFDRNSFANSWDRVNLRVSVDDA